MFSSTIKRSVASFGVVAGLLAAAGPANAGISVHDVVVTKLTSTVAESGPAQSGPQGGVTRLKATSRGGRAHEPGPHRWDRQELTRRIECAVANGWLDERPRRVIARAYKAGNERVVSAIAAAGPMACGAATWDLGQQPTA